MSLEEALAAVGVFKSEQLTTESDREEVEEDALDEWEAMGVPVGGGGECVDDISSEDSV